MSRKTVLVTTATGNVGSHVATLLLDQGFSVNALVRNPDSIAAQKLKEQGVSLFKGDFDVIPSIETAAEDVMVAMSLLLPERQEPKLMFYMSVMMADRNDEFPGYGPGYPTHNYKEAESRTEKSLQEAEFDHWTIISDQCLYSRCKLCLVTLPKGSCSHVSDSKPSDDLPLSRSLLAVCQQSKLFISVSE